MKPLQIDFRLKRQNRIKWFLLWGCESDISQLRGNGKADQLGCKGNVDSGVSQLVEGLPQALLESLAGYRAFAGHKVKELLQEGPSREMCFSRPETMTLYRLVGACASKLSGANMWKPEADSEDSQGCHGENPVCSWKSIQIHA